VYFGESFNDVNDGTGETFHGNQDADSLYFVVGILGYHYPDGLVDDVRVYDKVLSPDEIIKVMAGDPPLAWNPSPANESTPDIHVALSLNWLHLEMKPCKFL
jgi:hypothetical protein